jgi:lysophospholipase L1-like esterase
MRLPVLCLAILPAIAQPPATLTLAGDWLVRVTNEPYTNLPLFNPKAGGWARGAQLNPLKAQETTSRFLLDPTSFSLSDGARLLTPGTDYEIDLEWGTFGRLANSPIQPNQTVYATYRHAQMRLDAVVQTANGSIVIRTGEPRAAAPAQPAIHPNERHLGNIYIPIYLQKLTPEHLFPVLETAFPETPIAPTPTITRIKKRLENGEKLRILAWGDSVTDATYLPNRPADRWQEQFVTRLRQKYPKATIELLTQAWGGRNTASYLAEPPGSPKNYQETVLALKPDVVISEFVNDAGSKPEVIAKRYAKLEADFKAIQAEWIILTPHYTRPDWMNLTRERDIDDDPRPYVKAVREFAATHDVALADASLRWGRLWRQGIPHNTLLLNAINHPNAHGMRLFADALMALFQ